MMYINIDLLAEFLGVKKVAVCLLAPKPLFPLVFIFQILISRESKLHLYDNDDEMLFTQSYANTCTFTDLRSLKHSSYYHIGCVMKAITHLHVDWL